MRKEKEFRKTRTWKTRKERNEGSIIWKEGQKYGGKKLRRIMLEKY
jgi:hypothetical protein